MLLLPVPYPRFPSRFTTLEEDLLPVIPTAGMGNSLGMMQLQVGARRGGGPQG